MSMPRNNNIILIIVAHTDDETLGLGGTIFKHVLNGDKVYAISMTNGIASRGKSQKSKILERIQSSRQAAKILGFTWFKSANFPDNAMDSIPLLKIVKIIEKVKNQIKPTIIYTHSSADLNIDHRIVSQATLTAFRPQPNDSWLEIRAFEVVSSTDYGHKSITNLFLPNLYIDISDAWNKKLEALKKYDVEIKDSPHSRSYAGIENLAKYRGSQSGLNYAEAFEIIRKIDR